MLTSGSFPAATGWEAELQRRVLEDNVSASATQPIPKNLREQMEQRISGMPENEVEELSCFC